jgi:hypothetical protein
MKVIQKFLIETAINHPKKVMLFAGVCDTTILECISKD